jgi:hypothetical protein
MAQRFAEALDVMCAYAEKDKERLLFERFTLPNGIFVVHVEDAVTTGETQVRLNEAVSHATGHRMPIGRLFAFWNWTRKEEVHGFKITALVNRTMEYRWTDGRNPFTPDGRESVEPVRPKNHWRELTSADY